MKKTTNAERHHPCPPNYEKTPLTQKKKRKKGKGPGERGDNGGKSKDNIKTT